MGMTEYDEQLTLKLIIREELVELKVLFIWENFVGDEADDLGGENSIYVLYP